MPPSSVPQRVPTPGTHRGQRAGGLVDMLPHVPKHVFISYARGDQVYVDWLARYVSDAGFEVWYDRSIESGSSFGERIQSALESSAAVIAVLTPAAVASKWVLREISYADQHNIPLVPLLL